MLVLTAERNLLLFFYCKWPLYALLNPEGKSTRSCWEQRWRIGAVWNSELIPSPANSACQSLLGFCVNKHWTMAVCCDGLQASESRRISSTNPAQGSCRKANNVLLQLRSLLSSLHQPDTVTSYRAGQEIMANNVGREREREREIILAVVLCFMYRRKEKMKSDSSIRVTIWRGSPVGQQVAPSWSVGITMFRWLYSLKWSSRTLRIL